MGPHGPVPVSVRSYAVDHGRCRRQQWPTIAPLETVAAALGRDLVPLIVVTSAGTSTCNRSNRLSVSSPIMARDPLITTKHRNRLPPRTRAVVVKAAIDTLRYNLPSTFRRGFARGRSNPHVHGDWNTTSSAIIDVNRFFLRSPYGSHPGRDAGRGRSLIVAALRQLQPIMVRSRSRLTRQVQPRP